MEEERRPGNTRKVMSIKCNSLVSNGTRTQFLQLLGNHEPDMPYVAAKKSHAECINKEAFSTDLYEAYRKDNNLAEVGLYIAKRWNHPRSWLWDRMVWENLIYLHYSTAWHLTDTTIMSHSTSMGDLWQNSHLDKPCPIPCCVGILICRMLTGRNMRWLSGHITYFKQKVLTTVEQSASKTMTSSLWNLRWISSRTRRLWHKKRRAWERGRRTDLLIDWDKYKGLTCLSRQEPLMVSIAFCA